MVRLPPFQALLDAHGRDVHRFLIAQVGPLDADDCYQETWLAALAAYPRLRHASNLRSWILTIAHRKAIDHLRSRARADVPVAEATEAVGSDAPPTAPSAKTDKTPVPGPPTLNVAVTGPVPLVLLKLTFVIGPVAEYERL